MKTKDGIWVYNKLNYNFVLLENQPFKSKWIASELLKISSKNIDKYLDTGESYKDYYFFSRLPTLQFAPRPKGQKLD